MARHRGSRRIRPRLLPDRPRHAHRSLLGSVIGALGVPAAVCVALGVSTVVQPVIAVDFEKPDTPHSSTGRGTVAESLIAEHGCWRADEPRQGIPHAVVVTVAEPGRPARTVFSTDLVGAALDEVFGVDDPHLVVHAFCPVSPTAGEHRETLAGHG